MENPQVRIRRAALGYGRCTLIVSPEKPQTRRLCESLGFRYEKELFVFNEDYQKMVCPVR